MILELGLLSALILLIWEIDFRCHGHLDVVYLSLQLKRREWPLPPMLGPRPGGWDPQPPLFVVPTVAPSRPPPLPLEPPPLVPVAPLPERPKAAGFKAPPPPVPTGAPQEFRPPTQNVIPV